MQAVQKRVEYEVRPSVTPRKRVVKIEGNVAYISNGFAAQKPRIAPAAKTAARPAPRPAAKPAAKPKKGLVSTLLIVFAAFCAMSVMVSRYAVACSVGARNNELKESIAEVQTQIEALQVDIELKDNLAYVQKSARDDLKMKYPDPGQIVEITPDG
jgi:cell division protein FtsL